MCPRVLVLGAGAAGLVAAREAALRGCAVGVVEHQTLPGRKLGITGGGLCNVTNTEIHAKRYLSANPHFVKSALARFGRWDTVAMLGELDIGTTERERGELFCDQRATLLAERLWARAEEAGAELLRGYRIEGVVSKPSGGFVVEGARGPLEADAVIVATGGASWPKVGATSVGLDIARSLGLPIVEPRPGLVPLLLGREDLDRLGPLSGNALEVVARCQGSPAFRANMLFTHRGLSGPAILQISSFWRPGQPITVDLLPDLDVGRELREARSASPKIQLRTVLARWLPRRVVAALLPRETAEQLMGQTSNARIEAIHQTLHRYTLHPVGTAGWDKAEVMLGGVDTRAVSSKTMEARALPGLHFAGEVLDVTGWLGGYNLQWAWSSGWVAGRSVRASAGAAGRPGG
jgi:predicted Rossmann fold flavoprotein